MSSSRSLMHFSSRTLIEVSCFYKVDWPPRFDVVLALKKNSNFNEIKTHILEIFQPLNFCKQFSEALKKWILLLNWWGILADIRQTLNDAKFVDLLAKFFQLIETRSSCLNFSDSFRWHKNTNGEPELDHELALQQQKIALSALLLRQQGTEIYDKSCRSLTRCLQSRRASGSSSPIQPTVRSLRFFLLSLPLSLLVPPAHPPVYPVDWCSADITWKRDHSKHCYGRRLRAQ